MKTLFRAWARDARSPMTKASRMIERGHEPSLAASTWGVDKRLLLKYCRFLGLQK